jgi:hypothetical protein
VSSCDPAAQTLCGRHSSQLVLLISSDLHPSLGCKAIGIHRMIRRLRFIVGIGFGLIAVLAGIGLWSALPERRASKPPHSAAIIKHAFELAPANQDHELESPEIAIDTKGRIYLVWTSREKEGQRTLFIANSSDNGGTFSEPRVVSRSAIHEIELQGDQGATQEMGMTPRLATSGDNVSVAWTQSVAENSTVCLVSIESNDGAQSFSIPSSVNQSLEACPSFASLAAWNDRRAYCWLDVRVQQRQVMAALRQGENGVQEHSVFTLQAPAQTCQCCPTALAFGSQGQLFVAFRHANQILLAHAKDHLSEFASIITLAEVAPAAARCGHDCPSLAIDKETVHVSWTDAKTGVPRVCCATARLADMVFQTQAINADTKNSQGNCKLQSANGTLHAVWEEEPPAEQFISIDLQEDTEVLQQSRVIMYSSRPMRTGVFEPARRVDDSLGAIQSRPALAANSNGDVFVVWNQSDGLERSVVVKRIIAE